MEHILSCLFEVVLRGDTRERNFLWEKIDLEDIALTHGIGEVTLVAAIVFRRGTNIPSDLAVLTEGGATVRSNVGDDSGAKDSNGSAVEVVVAKEGGMGR